MRFVVWRRCALALLACPLSATAQQAATVTLLEGPAVLVRDATRYALAEGVRFRPGDIIEVSDKGLAEIEYPEGATIALASGTRMLSIAAPRGKAAGSDYYVTHGVLKISRVKQGDTIRFLTPAFIVQPGEGTAVLAFGDAEGSLFIESGEARVIEPSGRGTPPTVRLKTGEFYTRKAEQKGAIAQRPSPNFIAGLPRLFLDPLPSRLARYKDRDVPPKRIEDVSYAQVEEWLKAPPEIRRPLMPRFRPRLSDPAFRAALAANLKFHPEWDPILYPEKYKPKNPPPGTPAGAAGAAQ